MINEAYQNECKCHICGSPRLSKLKFETWTSRIREVGGECLFKCETCDLVFANPFPKINYNQAFYNGKEFLGGSAGGNTAPREYLIERLILIEKQFQLKTSLNILEIGCSTGVFLEYAKKRGHKVKGVEISEYAASVAINKGLDVSIGKVENTNIPQKSVDFIHINHALEHLVDPLSTLKYLKNLLRSGGIIVAEVPNEFGNLSYRMKKCLSRDSLIRVTPTQHSYFFNPRSLSRLFNIAGYEIKRLATPSRIRTPYHFLNVLAYFQDKLLLGQNIEIWGSSKI